MVSLVGSLAAEEPTGSQHKLPRAFKAIDTRKLMGSPNPLPLEAVLAFPKLKFERPTEITYAGDGSNRLFVVEQAGIVRVFENRNDVSEAQVFLDLREVVLREGNEEGLLGLAFHPQFKQNGEFFVYYSTKPRSSVISRFRVSKDGATANRESEEKLLQIPQPYSNHNGGSIKFGPDGHLYIGLGDGGARDDPHGNGQNLATLLGSILRIDVDHKGENRAYAIPKDNPFANRAGARGEIWAYGFRNVWRIAFDRKTGELWAADVGQDRFEEVNLVERGSNYGWNIREGKHDFKPNTPAKPESLREPLVEYFRGEGQSITGGIVYRGQQLHDFSGAYFFGDYLSGNVWALWHEDGRLVKNTQVARTGLQIAAFGEDQAGEMYLCAFDGSIYRLQPRKIDFDATAKAFPHKLSETGLFTSVPKNEPAEGLIPYELNIPFWSDFAVKDRYIALPREVSVKFRGKEKWEFPQGTVFVKTFWMHRDRKNMRDPIRLETRLLVNADEGWVGYTYVYDDDQTEAHLLDSWLTKPIEVQTDDGTIDQHYYFPSRSDCLTCHTKQDGFVLGLNTRQMNRKLAYRGERVDQIEFLGGLGVFTEKLPAATKDREQFPDWGFGNFDRSDSDRGTTLPEKPPGEINELARGWLEVNCAMCHRNEGIAPLQHDMRFHAETEKLNLINKSPKMGQLRATGSLLVKPGNPEQSELLFRIGRRGDWQMPPLATHHVDPQGYEVIRKWIEKMADR